MAAIFVLPVMVENKKTKLELCESEIRIPLDESTVTIQYGDIKSVQTKNADDFLLKVKGGETIIILRFETLGPRDLAKAVIMDAMAPYEAIQKTALNNNLEVKALHSSLKRSNLKNIINSAVADVYQNPNLYVQRPVLDIFSKDFINSLTQPVVDTFIGMNCTLNQFYNQFISTYFYDIKNPKGPLDRLIAENIRNSARGSGRSTEGTPEPVNDGGADGKPEDGTAINYATRINSYSLMVLSAATTKISDDTRLNKKKEAEFSPAIPFDLEKEESKVETVISNPNPFEIKKLSCDFVPEIVGPYPAFQYDMKDFELARDICKVVYQQRENAGVVNEAMEFSRNFEEMIVGHYGEESRKYVERLMPSFYIKADQNK